MGALFRRWETVFVDLSSRFVLPFRVLEVQLAEQLSASSAAPHGGELVAGHLSRSVQCSSQERVLSTILKLTEGLVQVGLQRWDNHHLDSAACRNQVRLTCRRY